MDSGAKGGVVAVERKQDFPQTAGHFDAADLSAITSLLESIFAFITFYSCSSEFIRGSVVHFWFRLVRG